MSRHTLFSALALTASTLVYAQTTVTTALVPLASKSFAFSDLPYQVTGDQGGVRGPQFGYNLCNSTTEGQSSLCQVCRSLILSRAYHQRSTFVDYARKHTRRFLHVEFVSAERQHRCE